MRLIDADELIRRLNDSGIEFNANINNVILEQPTAYDVDKVVDELDSAEYPYYLFDDDGCEINESLLMSGMVENIVREGGVDENH